MLTGAEITANGSMPLHNFYNSKFHPASKSAGRTAAFLLAALCTGDTGREAVVKRLHQFPAFELRRFTGIPLN
jgi:hypothetical protein